VGTRLGHGAWKIMYYDVLLMISTETASSNQWINFGLHLAKD